MDYQRILLAVDLTPASLLVGQRAGALAAAFDAQLRILHVVEPIAPVPTIPLDALAPTLLTSQAGMIRSAEEQMEKLAGKLDLRGLRWSVVVGDTRSEIVRAAADYGMDLIVIGNRERHGFAFLFKPTEDAVLQRAPCDVLAVRLSDEEARPAGL